MKASIVYNSHSGTTKGFAEAIGEYLSEKGVDCRVGSIDNYDREFFQQADLVLLGAWTNGLFILAQHPDRPWKQFVKSMPAARGKPVVLFTTYKLATGSMFRKMESRLRKKTDSPVLRLRSKGRSLDEKHREQLDRLFEQN